jgi:hypothetical protein
MLNFSTSIGMFNANPVMPVFDDLGGAVNVVTVHANGRMCFTAVVSGQQ